jgi:hypothetical protein
MAAAGHSGVSAADHVRGAVPSRTRAGAGSSRDLCERIADFVAERGVVGDVGGGRQAFMEGQINNAPQLVVAVAQVAQVAQVTHSLNMSGVTVASPAEQRGVRTTRRRP